MRNKKKALILAATTVTILMFVTSSISCNQNLSATDQEEETMVSDSKPDRPLPKEESKDSSLLKGINNKNHNYVKYEDKVYYRQYHKDSFADGGLFKQYLPIEGSNKEMICLYPDGKKEKIFVDQGYGPFYILKDRFYMEEMLENSAPQIYSVDMEGNHRIDYGEGWIRDVDIEDNILILELLNQEDKYSAGIFVLDGNNGDVLQVIEDQERNISFVAYADKRIYYQETDRLEIEGEEYKKEDHIKLFSAAPDGTDKKLLADVKEMSDYGQSIQKLQVAEGVVYFSYGAYAGSAQAYQGGGIASVNADGTDYKTLVRSKGSGFYIQKLEGKTILHHNDMIEMAGQHLMAIDIDTKVETESELQLPYIEKFELNKLFCGDLFGYGETDSVYVIADDTGAVIEIADSLKNYTVPKFDEEAAMQYGFVFRDLALIDGDLYFTAETSQYDSNYSIGWRDGYRRIWTGVYRMELDHQTVELLYSY